MQILAAAWRNARVLLYRVSDFYVGAMFEVVPSGVDAGGPCRL